MSTFEAIILGVLQGLTEFLPVSSSGHLKLVQSLMGYENLNQYLVFDLICHLGTLLAIFCFFSGQIKQAVTKDKVRCLQIIVGTLPLFPLLLIMKPIKAVYDHPQYLGFGFLTTALLLYIGIRWGWDAPQPILSKRKWRDALFIGLAQAVAILPGVSRSGSTVSISRRLGWSKQDALAFSFLLAIPAILGGTTLEIGKLWLAPASTNMPVNWLAYAAGFAASFSVGLLALKLLMRMAINDKFIYFVWYCLFIGIFSLAHFYG